VTKRATFWVIFSQAHLVTLITPTDGLGLSSFSTTTTTAALSFWKVSHFYLCVYICTYNAPSKHGATLFFRKPIFRTPKFRPSVVRIWTKYQNFEKSNVRHTKCSTDQIFKISFVRNDNISNFKMSNISIDFCT
jgi:hypothetical protein